jgi:TP901 family phage tail tape measure protein
MAAVVGDLLVRLQANTGAFGKAMAAAAGSIGGITTAALAGSAAIAGLGIAAVKTAAEFEKGMTRVAAVSNATAGEYRKLESSALSMAAKTEFTARQVADGMGFLAMAGMDATQVVEAMPKALQLASAGMIDVATASNIVTNVMAGMGLEMHELARANDTIVAAITGSNTDVRMLGESFKYVGPVAKSAGISFEEVTAAIGLLGNAGIQGSMAGTTLRGAITKLLNPSEQASEILDQFGIEVMNADGSMRSLEDIIKQINLSGLADDAAGTARMMEIFGLRAGPGMQALVDQGSDALGKFTARLEGAGGMAKRIADMQMSTLTGRFKIMQSAIEGLVIDIGQRLIPMSKSFVDGITKMVNWVNSFSSEAKNAVISIAALTAGFTALKVVLTGLVALVRSQAFISFMTKIAALAAPVLALAAAFAGILLILGSLSRVWKANHNEIKQGLENIKNWFISTWKTASAASSKAFDEMLSVARDFMKFIQEKVFTPLRNLAISGMGFALGLDDKEIEAIKKIAEQEGGVIGSKDDLERLTKAADEAKEKFDKSWEALKEEGKFVADGVIESGKQLGSDIVDSFSEGTRIFKETLEVKFGKFARDVLNLGGAVGKGGAPSGAGTGAGTKAPEKTRLQKYADETLLRYRKMRMGWLAKEQEIIDKDLKAREEAAAKLKSGLDSIGIGFMTSLGKVGDLFAAGAQGLEQTGSPWGALIAVLIELIRDTEFFSTLITHLNGTVKQVVGSLDLILAPFAQVMPMLNVATDLAFQFLAMLTKLDVILLGLTKGFGWMAEGMEWALRALTKGWNTMIKAIADWVDKIPGLGKVANGIRRLVISWEDAVARTDELYGRNMEELAEATNKATDAMLGVPEGFKVARERYEATMPDIAGPPPGSQAQASGAGADDPYAGLPESMRPNRGGGGGVTVNVNGTDYPEEVARKVVEILESGAFNRTGSLKSYSSPYSVPYKL